MDPLSAVFDDTSIKTRLRDLEQPCCIVQKGSLIGVAGCKEAAEGHGSDGLKPVAYASRYLPEYLGDPEFKKDYNVRYCYCAGAMANAIASETMVIALGKAGCLASFGSGGLLPSRVEKAIQQIQKALPEGPYAFNLIHSPNEPAIEQAVVKLYLDYQVRCVEAAAFITLTPFIVWYRVAGLRRRPDGTVEIQNKVIAKVSRTEVATRFLEPPPEKMVSKLLDQGLITPEQASLAGSVPMADDITAEADSGGHTDNRPLVPLLSSIIALRNQIQEVYTYPKAVRVGAAGGIGTPEAAYAAFAIGAAYVVTGSVNQSCVESGASPHTRELLAKADMADVVMAPASDMFEMGVKLQVLKRGTFFPMRAQKLYRLYTDYESIEAIPKTELDLLEKQIFKKSLEEVWEETRHFFETRDPDQIERAHRDPKKKMALIFRWYLGLASRWSNAGDPDRKLDYQIWCGPSMGAFNAWVKGSFLEPVSNRNVVDVAACIMNGAAYLNRLMMLKSQGIQMAPFYSVIVPEKVSLFKS